MTRYCEIPSETADIRSDGAYIRGRGIVDSRTACVQGRVIALHLSMENSVLNPESRHAGTPAKCLAPRPARCIAMES
jgi:hypothetical protein